MTQAATADLLAIAEALVPGADLDRATVADGQFHQVVLVPGVAAVRISRSATAAAALPRRVALAREIAGAGLPFAVPEPLGEVVRFGERAAVATSWVDGVGHPEGSGDPRALRELWEAIGGVPLTAGLRAVLGEPHEYAGGARWPEVMAEEVVPRLPVEWRDAARRRVDAVLGLPPVPARLVHGDLGGENVRWSTDGKLVGVLDWDLAQPHDPAIDAACLAWHGWETVKAAVDGETYRRAGVWYGVFGIEQIGAAALEGMSAELMDWYVTNAVAWLEQTSEWVQP